tara:strand:- start:10906 stop:11520 length:615 start_codon:yes stop_codon:yes gene_type:complete
MNKEMEKLKEKHAKEIGEARLEASVLKAIPSTEKPRHVYVHDDHVSVKYDKDSYPSHHSLAEAINIMKRWKPFIITAEHWRDSCVSVRPAKLTSKRDKKNAVLEFESYAQVKDEEGRGYGSQGEIVTNYAHQTLTFWAEIKGGVRGGDTIIDVDIMVRFPWRGGADKTRKWWRGAPSSSTSYYWGDSISFDAWAGREEEEKSYE